MVQVEFYEMEPGKEPFSWLWDDSEDAAVSQAMWRAGFDDQEAEAWFAAARVAFDARGVAGTPSDIAAAAAYWKVAAFEPDDVRDWAEMFPDIEDPREVPAEARRWRDSGFTAGTAWRWCTQEGYLSATPLQRAVIFENAGWAPGTVRLLEIFLRRHPNLRDLDDELMGWVKLDLNVELALDLVRAGVIATEAPTFANWGNKSHLLEELRNRERALPAIDPHQAMIVNHLNHLGDPDELKVGKHLFRDPVPDLSDDNQAEEETRRSDQARRSVLGDPDGDGVHLVGVVEFSSDSSEEQWSMAGNRVRGSICVAAQELGFSRTSVAFEKSGSDLLIGALPDGTRVAAYGVQVDEPAGFFLSRRPDELERLRWALSVLDDEFGA